MVPLLYHDEWDSRLVIHLEFHTGLADSTQLVGEDMTELSLTHAVTVENDARRLEPRRNIELNQKLLHHRRQLMNHLLSVLLDPHRGWIPAGMTVHTAYHLRQQVTRNSSGDEIANVNFLYDDIIHVLQNTIDSYINSAMDRSGYVLECMFTKFSEITQYNGHYAVQGHSRLLILVPIESSYTTSY